MTPARIITTMEHDIDAPAQSLLGIAALAAELAAQGVSGICLPTQGCRRGNWRTLRRGSPSGSVWQSIATPANWRNVRTSATFGKALEFSLENIRMAGPVVMQISFEVGNNTAVLRSHGVESLGDLLPFVAEFWRSSMMTLFSRVLEAPFPSKRMAFTYPAPAHRRNYERIFNCPVDFGADAMEWHFDADVLGRPCPNANPITAKVCQQFCDRVNVELCPILRRLPCRAQE